MQVLRADGAALPAVAQLRLSRAGPGWLAGDGGLVQRSDDLGATWRGPPGNLPAAAAQFDFAALAASGPEVWIAGSPGSRVFHSADSGRSWAAFATGSLLPLRAITFVDNRHGWAVGELGTVLATGDGGQIWRLQRCGGTRVALLVLAAEPHDVPLELVARAAGNDGYRTAVAVVGRRDLEIVPREDVPLVDRLHEAVVAVGGSASSCAWQFPLRQAGLGFRPPQIVEDWRRAVAPGGMAELHARLVREIRTWRPDAVLTGSSDPRQDEAVVSLVRQATAEAVGKAAGANCFRDQITDAGLEPWRARLAYAACQGRPGTAGAVELDTGQLAPALGRSPAKAASGPRGLLCDDFAPSPATLCFEPLGSSMPPVQPVPLAPPVPHPEDRRDEPGPAANRNETAPAGPRDLFSSLAIAPGSAARRDMPLAVGSAGPTPAGALDPFEAQRRKTRYVRAILERSLRDGASGEPLLAKLGELTRDLDRQAAGEILYQLANHYYRHGQWPSAAEAFGALADRYPDHALAPLAIRWLLRYYSSGEAAWRVQRDAAGQTRRLQRAVAIGRYVKRARLDWFLDPDIRFPLAAAYRGLGDARAAERLYQAQAERSRDGWWRCAQGELAIGRVPLVPHLAQPVSQRPARPVLWCVRARTRPRLDGRLDEAVWRDAKQAALASAEHDDADWPAIVMLAYDDKYLYLAAQCREPRATGSASATPGSAGGTPGPASATPASASAAPASPGGTGAGRPSDREEKSRPRPRDGDLSAYDRVEFMFDIDRDFATYYHLAVDRRGWTFDRCWENPTWDPQWFVATRLDEGRWTVEAAIALKELTGKPPQPGDVWALGLQRVVPGVGFQSWTTPAAAASVLPDGFGYLVFQ